MTTTTMSRLRATRAFEDAGGILFSALAFGTTLGGLCLGVSQDVFYWMQILPMMLVCILTGIHLCYAISSLAVTLAKPRSRFTSLLSDLFWLIPALIIGIGFASYYAWTVRHYPNCGQTIYNHWNASTCPLTNAGLACTWIYVVYTACLLVVRCIRYHKAKAPVKMSLTELARLTGQEAVELSPKARFSED